MWQLILGPVFGLLGSAFQKWMDAKDKAADRAHELAVMDKEVDLAAKRMQIESEGRQAEAESRAFSDSYKFANDKLVPEGQKLTKGQTWLALLIDAFTKLIRPATTTWYQFAVAGVFVWCAWKAGGNVDEETANTIVKEVIFSIIGMAETTLLWWYGIRGLSKRGK